MPLLYKHCNIPNTEYKHLPKHVMSDNKPQLINIYLNNKKSPFKINQTRLNFQLKTYVLNTWTSPRHPGFSMLASNDILTETLEANDNYKRMTFTVRLCSVLQNVPSSPGFLRQSQCKFQRGGREGRFGTELIYREVKHHHFTASNTDKN